MMSINRTQRQLRGLFISNTWALEPKGFEEIQARFKKEYPNTELQFECLEDGHTLAITGVVNEEFMSSSANLVAGYIYAHQNDDGFETPCIRRMDNRYHSFSPEVCARSEQPHTLRSATDPPEYESLPRPAPFPTRLMFWKPIHCDPKFFLRDAYSLLARIEEETGISIECDDTGDGIFIEGLDVSHVQVAEEKLATLDLCMGLVANPNRTVMIIGDPIGPHDAKYRILNYSKLSGTALWRVLGNDDCVYLSKTLLALVACEFDEKKNQWRPLGKFRFPPHINVNRYSDTTQDWEEFDFPEFAPNSSYEAFPHVEMHLLETSDISTSGSSTHLRKFIARNKAITIYDWEDAGSQPSPGLIDHLRVHDEPVIKRDESKLPEPYEKISTSLGHPSQRAHEDLQTQFSHTSVHNDGNVSRAEKLRMKPACIMLNPQAPSFTPSHTDKNQSQSTSHEKAKSNKQLAESAEPTEDDKTEELKPNFKAASPQETHNKNVVLPIPEAALIGHDHGTPAVDPLVDASIASDEASVGSTGFSDKKQRDLHAYGEESPSASNKNNEIARQYLLNQTSLHTRPFAHRFHLDLQGLHWEPSATGGHGSEPTADERIGCSSNRMTATNEQSVVDNEVKKPDLRVTMHHPRPVLNLQNQSKNLEETKQRDIIDQLGSPRGSCTSEQTIHQRSASHTSTPSIKKEGGIEDPVKTLFDLLVPTLAIATAFPGVMNLEFQFGLNPIVNMENPSQNHEYNHEELRRLFSPNENGVYRPPTTFFNRLTTSPADIDHIISLQVEGRRIFDDQVNNWGIKYDFHCYVDTDRAIIISVGSRQNFMIHYPEVTLGSVHLNFPGQIWDASATLLGFIGCPVGTDMDLDRIALKMVKSMSIEPNSGSLRFLFRPPKTRITVGKITMERCTRHKYECDNISGIYLQIKETQELYTTVSILDPRIMVAQTGSREDMLRDGTQWWQASVISTSVERILATNKFTMPGAANGGWTPEDVLDDVGGTAGLRAMFDVSKMVVEGIDAVGFWNKGPTSLLVKTGTLDELIASSEGDEEAHSLSSLGSDCLDAFDM